MDKKVLFALFFVLIQSAIAEIDIAFDKDNYNLGEKISITASVKHDEDLVNAFFRIDLDCPKETIEILSITKSLEADYRENILINDFYTTKSMIGECRVKAQLKNHERSLIESKTSESFEIKNQLEIKCDEASARPGEKTSILCTIRKFDKSLLDEGTSEVSFMGNKYSPEINSGILSFLLPIAEDTRSGTEKIAIKVTDKNGNYCDTLLKIRIIGIPSMIVQRINKEEFVPGDSIEIRPILYDTNSDVIEEKIKTEIKNPQGKTIVSGEVNSTKFFTYKFGSFSEPGEYIIESSSKGISKKDKVKVLESKNIDMKYENQNLILKNIGNLKLDEERTIILENEEGKYLVNKRIKLSPGESKTIDLSKEVPFGSYNIIVPSKDSDMTINLVNKTQIEDNRPLIKKMTSGFGMVTGAAISSARYVSKRPLLASVFLIVIILAIILFYGRDFIFKNVKRLKIDKKEGVHIEPSDYVDVENIFDDFDYNSKNNK